MKSSEVSRSGGSVAISMPGADWQSENEPFGIGVRARSFVPSFPRTKDAASMTNDQVFPKPSSEVLRKMDDEALIMAFQSGEHEVYRFLVERHQERIRNLLYSIFHDRDFIDDLAQEIFIKAYQALPHFRFEASFYTWLYRIAVNKSRDELRKKKARRFIGPYFFAGSSGFLSLPSMYGLHGLARTGPGVFHTTLNWPSALTSPMNTGLCR